MSELWDAWPRESSRAHARFRHYVEQGPVRQLTLTAEKFGVAVSTISEQASRFEWRRRAAAWDNAQGLRDCPAPERLQEAAAAAPITSVSVSDDTRAAEKAYLALIEEFRQAVEALGRDQLVTARAMTAKAKGSVRRLLEDDRPISARDLPAFINATVTLGTAAQAQWAKSLGVESLLQRMEAAIQDPADVTEAEIVS